MFVRKKNFNFKDYLKSLVYVRIISFVVQPKKVFFFKHTFLSGFIVRCSTERYITQLKLEPILIREKFGLKNFQ